MTELEEKIIKNIHSKIELEQNNFVYEYQEAKSNSPFSKVVLTDKEKLQLKVSFSYAEFDYVINNYQDKFKKNDFLEDCIYLLKEFKQTQQASKCNAIYNILNKYFTIYSFYKDNYAAHPRWNGFAIESFIECPVELREMIKEKVLKIKAEKRKQSRLAYKENADKVEKEIIEELEL